MPVLFAITLFLSAALLFMVQPMVGKMILPLLGGGAGVWNTCMVFFQAMLLLGYLYAHRLSSVPSIGKQVRIHIGVLLITSLGMAAAMALTSENSPIPIMKSLAPEGSAFPFLNILALLCVAIGVPFFAVSTSAPLLQRWFSATGHSSAKDPYFLYAASNAGSLISLLGYPLVTEPSLKLLQQTWLWASGFLLLLGMTIQCGRSAMNPLLPPNANKPTTPSVPSPPAAFTRISTRRKLKWMGWAFVPSSLMLGVTTHMTTDIASVPLLWVIPLALYLLTFIIAFAKTPEWLRPILGNLSPVATLILVFLITSGVSGLSTFATLTVHLVVYFLAALLMHYELARDRPEAQHLTEFYLVMSVGGMLGGIFNAIITPLIFPYTYEYPITIVIGCMLIPALLTDEAKAERENIPEEKKNARAGIQLMLDAMIPLIMLTAVAALYWAAGTDTFDETGDMIAQAMNKVIAFCGLSMTIQPITVKQFLAFAPPCMACFLFIDRPQRFGLCVAAVLFMHYYTQAQNDRIRYTSRSFYGIMRVDEDIEKDRKTQYFQHVRTMKKNEDGEDFLSIEDSFYYSSVRIRSLMHGTTLHGRQIVEPFKVRVKFDKENDEFIEQTSPVLPLFRDDVRMLGCTSPWESLALIGAKQSWDATKDPLTYYHRTGPVGDMFRASIGRTVANHDRLPVVGMVGLGTGSVACYAGSGMKLTFYEIDPSVIKLVEKPTKIMNKKEVKEKNAAPEYGPFSFIDDARKRGAEIDFILGDARLTLDSNKDAKYDLLLIDAFSSDSIPIHLLTKQSVKLYEERLAPKGLLAIHISNRYIQLDPVVAAIAKENGLVCRIFSDSNDGLPGKTASSWVVLARNEEELGSPFILKAKTTPEEIIQGDWRAELKQTGEGKTPGGEFGYAQIRGNKVLCDIGGKLEEWTIELKSAPNYARFELVRGDKAYHGIMETNEFGHLELCYTPKNLPIPTEFEFGKDISRVVLKSTEKVNWAPIPLMPDVHAWTDDHADVLRVMKLKEVQALRGMLGFPVPIKD